MNETLFTEIIASPSGGLDFIDTNLTTTGTITVGGCTGCGTGGDVEDIWVNESGDTMTGELGATNLTSSSQIGIKTGTAWSQGKHLNFKSENFMMGAHVPAIELVDTGMMFLETTSEAGLFLWLRTALNDSGEQGYMYVDNVGVDGGGLLQYPSAGFGMGDLFALISEDGIRLHPTSTINMNDYIEFNMTADTCQVSTNKSSITFAGDVIGTNITANNFTGTFYGDGAQITGLTASQVGLGDVYNVKQINESIGTAKGDLICYTGSSAPVRVAVGTDGQVLYANSSEASGVQWRTPSAGGSDVNYAVQGTTINTATLTDGQTVYWGNIGLAPTTTADNTRVYFPQAGTITSAYVFMQCATAGTAEAWASYIRVNNTADTLIQSLTLSNTRRVWANTSLSTAVGQGGYMEIKQVQPTWVTNPANCRRNFILYVD